MCSNATPIKHLVISGGGPLGLRFLGALEHLEQCRFWQHAQLESIYATSVGAVIGAFICLNYDWQTLNKYIVDRPWHEVFKVTAKQLFDSYFNKGLFDENLMQIIFKPLLQAKNMSVNITLQEFYEATHIDFHVFAFELNTFSTVEFSHTTHGHMRLLTVLTMTSALPGIFMPMVVDVDENVDEEGEGEEKEKGKEKEKEGEGEGKEKEGEGKEGEEKGKEEKTIKQIKHKCFIDGGVMCNYPINECVRDHTNESEILGIKSAYVQASLNAEVTKESSLLEYVVCLTINSMNFIRETVKLHHIANTVECVTDTNPLTLNVIQASVYDSAMRQQWIDAGKEDADRFLKSIHFCSG